MFSLERLTQHPLFFPVARILSVVTGMVFTGLTVAFYTKSPVARAIWPWDYTTLSDMSYIFLASITIAIAAPVIWIGLSGELAAATGGTLNLGITFVGSGIFMLQSYSIRENPRLLSGALFLVLLLAGLVIIYLVTRRLPFRDTRPMPRLVYRTFAFFVVALLIAGTLLALKQPVFPWRLSGEASIIYGWIFLGPAAYFGYSLYRPVWPNAVGNLLGFLAYDLVLIFPFLARFSDVEPEYRLSLIIYTTIVIFSGVLAVYYLFVHRETRLLRRG